MIRVIREPLKRIQECPHCKCVFEYEKEDIQREQIYTNEHRFYVECPCCKAELLLSIL